MDKNMPAATTTTSALDGDTVYDDVRAEDPSNLPIPKRVLVIGGGPAGLVSLRNLTERGQFDTVQLVERRSDIGGVWCVYHPRRVCYEPLLTLASSPSSCTIISSSSSPSPSPYL